MQGTYEFMSRLLVKSLRYPEPHLHSPVDDLESFYYVAQWAAAFNDGAVGGRYNGNGIEQFREMISGDQREMAIGDVRERLKPLTAETKYGPFFAQSLHVLTPWRGELGSLTSDWVDVTDKAFELSEPEREKYLGKNFLIYGYRGVAEYLELVHKHRGSLQV